MDTIRICAILIFVHPNLQKRPILQTSNSCWVKINSERKLMGLRYIVAYMCVP